MPKILLLPLFMFVFAATGCSGPGKIMNTWIGKTKDDLVKTLGPATRVIDNGANGVIFMYSATVDVREAPQPAFEVTPTQGDGYTTEKSVPARQGKPYLKLKMFYINPAGVIVSWKIVDV